MRPDPDGRIVCFICRRRRPPSALKDRRCQDREECYAAFAKLTPVPTPDAPIRPDRHPL